MNWIDHIAPFESLSSFHLRMIYKGIFEPSQYLLTRSDKQWLLSNFPDKFYSASTYGKNFSELLEQHTFYPVIKLLADKTLKLNIHKHAQRIEKRVSLFRLIGNNQRWVEMKFCPVCFTEQLKSYGFNWLLRGWHLPLVTCCIKHKLNLVSYKCFCSSEECSFSTFITGIFTGTCPKCFCATWEVEPEKPTRKQLSTARWMIGFVSLEPMYISQAQHKTLFHKVNGLESAANVEIEKSVKLLFPKYGAFGKDRIYKSLHKWSKAIYPIDPEVFYLAIIKTFDTPNSFRAYIQSTNEPVYIDNFELNLKLDLTERYRLFEDLTLHVYKPNAYLWGRYIRVLI